MSALFSPALLKVQCAELERELAEMSKQIISPVRMREKWERHVAAFKQLRAEHALLTTRLASAGEAARLKEEVSDV